MGTNALVREVYSTLYFQLNTCLGSLLCGRRSLMLVVVYSALVYMFSFVDEVHGGSLELTVMKEEAGFNVTVEVPQNPCTEGATLTHTSYSQTGKQVRSKHIHGQWVTLSDLQYWTDNLFVVKIQCGESIDTYTENFQMIPGGKRVTLG